MRIGLEKVCLNPSLLRNLGNCGYLCNQASVDRDLNHGIVLLQKLLGDRLQCLFAPQHGLESTVQDNMIETPHSIHQGSGLKIYSLYSETREPTASMLQGLDTIIIDLQLVGCRVYTFKWTIAACLRAAVKYGKRVVVLDRPNPLGGVVVEGRVIDPSMYSFVGEDQIPMRHGLTPGEFAQFVNRRIGAELLVIPMDDWQPQSLWDHNQRHWILTSPNLPSFESVLFYPGFVMLEGTHLSEGRGTTLPFQLVGAHDLQVNSSMIEQMQSLAHQGDAVFLRPCEFQPTSSKFAQVGCKGLHLIPRQPQGIYSYRLALAFLYLVHQQGKLTFTDPPYEYNLIEKPLDLIIGYKGATQMVYSKSPLDSFWSEGVLEYTQQVKEFLIYKRQMQIQ